MNAEMIQRAGTLPVVLGIALLFGITPLFADPDQKAEIVILGIAQDAGYPQVGCYQDHCQRAWKNPELRRHAASLAVVDHSQKAVHLIEATPDIREQLYALQSVAPDPTYRLASVFLTHAHMGHYSGLLHFGREADGSRLIPVYAMPRMLSFLEDNGPWSQLVQLKNILLKPWPRARALDLGSEITISALDVPHRDEFSETLGLRIQGPRKSALFIPDIDKWSRWTTDIRKLIPSVDYAFIDGTFFSGDELPGRDMSSIPHPSVRESMALLEDLPKRDRAKVYFIHLNHSNPLHLEGSEAQHEVKRRGFKLAEEGQRLPL